MENDEQFCTRCAEMPAIVHVRDDFLCGPCYETAIRRTTSARRARRASLS